MGSAVIEGYINENKKIILLLMLHQNIMYQFGGAMIESEKLSELLKPANQLKSPDDIKKELNKKKSH